jgi:8-oxo-dGTP pyrophosphatase MutT (NUDIX family)
MMLVERNTALRNLVDGFVASCPERWSDLNPISKLWQDKLDMGHRHTYPAHITASAIAMMDHKVLMIRHATLARWLFPGGHMEAGETPAESAERELIEETGVRGRIIYPNPIDIDFHKIPANPRKAEPEHFHIDLRYLLAPQVALLSFDRSEVDAAEWIELSELKGSRLYRVLSEQSSS